MNCRRLLLSFTALLFFVVVCECKKPGTCPPILYSSVCKHTCLSDYECPGRMLCCRTFCGGSLCNPPVSRRVQAPLGVKPGTCPSKPRGRWICSSRCSTDRDCGGNKKCCKNRCGARACMKPEEELGPEI
ncbi:WAP four-disulfide core domain protein 2-like [Agrilus planipennis]|uniref:WAP four-disulfide core domain protein 2-like n=1 Tax=Agrilus planipennis TaxID=224129 RepID=A0A1W4WH03_AGRPL|nr:WAP four-disulfide core domain protein 2-like [Agrilus planipennis]